MSFSEWSDQTSSAPVMKNIWEHEGIPTLSLSDVSSPFHRFENSGRKTDIRLGNDEFELWKFGHLFHGERFDIFLSKRTYFRIYLDVHPYSQMEIEDANLKVRTKAISQSRKGKNYFLCFDEHEAENLRALVRRQKFPAQVDSYEVLVREGN